MNDTMTPTILPAEGSQPGAELALTQVQQLTNTGSSLAAQVQATVQARYIVAMQRPRDWSVVRQRLLAECRRPGFAEQAQYRKPVGGGKFVTGESIRFAEAAARNMGNIVTEVLAIDDDDEKRTLRVVTTDIETNSSFSTDIVVRKTVERRFTKEGQTVISSRRNSNGDVVHLVEATEDDILVKSGNAVSKATRNNILRLLPGDIVDDCLAECQKTMSGKAQVDPAAENKRLQDAFGFFGVMPTDLAAYLGHDATQLTKAELEELRGLYAGVKLGETTWAQVMQTKAEALGKAADTATSRAAAAVTAKLEKK